MGSRIASMQPYYGGGYPPPQMYRPPMYPGMPQPGMPQPMYPGAPGMVPGMAPPGVGQSMLPRGPVPNVISAAPQAKEQHTTVYVGKIPQGLPDTFLKELLEKCGVVSSWERVTDPTTGQPKSFGFCKFADADGVLRALRLLNALDVDSSQLLLKVDQKTQSYLDAYEAEKNMAAGGGASAGEQNDSEAVAGIKQLVDKRPARTVQPSSLGAPGGPEKTREEREREREEERQRHRKREAEAELQKRERDWQRRETDKEREQQREENRKSSFERDVAKRVADDEAALKEDEEWDTWWQRHEKVGHQRRRMRDREEDDDKADRRREKEESEAADRKKIEDEEMRKKEEESRKVEDAAKEAARAKLSAALAGKKEATLKRKASSLFKIDDDSDAKKQLIKLEYTEEELKARDPNYKTAAELAELAVQEKAKKVREQVSKLVKIIPTDKEELFKHDLNWETVDKGQIVATKMTPWITKKIAEFLGEEEESMIKFVSGMLEQHTAAAEVVEKLAVILEDDAEAFVIKMWRMLIFEYMRWEIEQSADDSKQEEEDEGETFSLMASLK